MVGQNRMTELGLRRLRELGEVVGPVPRDAMPGQLAWADVLVLPTLSEGSNVVYEGMAAGLAVVTTPNAGSIIQHGVDGLIVPPRDPHALADAIAALVGAEGLCLQLGEAARATVRDNDINTYAHGLASVLASECRAAPLAEI